MASVMPADLHSQGLVIDALGVHHSLGVNGRESPPVTRLSMV